MAVCHGDSRHINIVKKEDKPGIDIHISGEAKNEQVHIPVVMSKEGVDIVYNDFYIEDGADVTIIAGCGIHGEGCSETRHDGIHAFHVGKGANVRYEEKHYGEGEGTGARVLNPVTKIYVGEDSVFTLETTQIRGVDATERENYIELADNAKLFVTEKLMTDEGQTAVSNMDVELNGENSSARIVSRSVGKGTSKQVFHPRAIGNNQCHAHIQCDSIIMDNAEISSIPEIDARHVDAQIIHEAAIGKIVEPFPNGKQQVVSEVMVILLIEHSKLTQRYGNHMKMLLASHFSGQIAEKRLPVSQMGQIILLDLAGLKVAVQSEGSDTENHAVKQNLRIEQLKPGKNHRNRGKGVDYPHHLRRHRRTIAQVAPQHHQYLNGHDGISQPVQRPADVFALRGKVEQ